MRLSHHPPGALRRALVPRLGRCQAFGACCGAAPSSGMHAYFVAALGGCPVVACIPKLPGSLLTAAG
eukprot:10145483-Alexandrium_andersonii.AAC.1